MNLISEAKKSGSRLERACDYAGISLKTYKRWKKKPQGEDLRKGPNEIKNRLTEQEKEKIIKICNSDEFIDMPPCKIVPKLSDLGIYIASESSIYRILRSKGQITHRGRSKPREPRNKPLLVATATNEVWSWDITYLKSYIQGLYFYLYMIIDIYTRKIVGWRVEDKEDQEYSSALIAETTLQEGVSDSLILHSDNGGPMKGSTMLATMEFLGVIPSFSRPKVSNDNPFSESLFKTMKYVPIYPTKGFKDIAAAREWVSKFVYWYNEIHLHSGLKYVTPAIKT